MCSCFGYFYLYLYVLLIRRAQRRTRGGAHCACDVSQLSRASGQDVLTVIKWNQPCADEHMHRRVGTPGKIHNVCLHIQSSSVMYMVIGIGSVEPTRGCDDPAWLIIVIMMIILVLIVMLIIVMII